MTKISNISKEEFEIHKIDPIFIDNKINKKYGKIVYKEKVFVCSWYSDMVEPIMKQVNEGIYAIGIDQNFVIINLNTGEIKLKLDLFYIFYNIEIYDNFIFLMTELEIIIISRRKNIILEKIALPEFYKNIKMNGREIKINCIDGSEIDFNLDQINN